MIAADAVQTTAASQPLLLAHNGASTDNYWYAPNVTNNNCSTPNASANQITGDFDIIAYVKHTTNGTLNALVSKNDNASNRGYNFVFESNTLTLYYGSTSLNTASATVTIASGSTLWVRCTRVSSTGIITFFTSNNASTTNPQSVTWTQLGTTISGITGALNSSSVNGLFIGSYISSTSGQSNEKIYRLTISNSIGGSPVVDFNPAQYNASTSQTAWTSSTGEVWTINQDSSTATGYRGVLVDRVTVMSDGIDDNMTNTFSLDTVKTIYNSYTIWNELATNSLFASNNGAQVIDASMNGASTNVTQIDNAGNSITISIVGTAKLRTIRTAVINGASSLQRINNGTASTGTLGASISTSMKIMQERNGSYKSKMIYTTLIVTSTADSTIQQTSTFNLLKTLNNL